MDRLAVRTSTMVTMVDHKKEPAIALRDKGLSCTEDTGGKIAEDRKACGQDTEEPYPIWIEIYPGVCGFVRQDRQTYFCHGGSDGPRFAFCHALTASKHEEIAISQIRRGDCYCPAR